MPVAPELRSVLVVVGEVVLLQHRPPKFVVMVVTTIVTDDGKLRDYTHGLITDAICEETWTIHPDDPLCASGHYLWNLTHSRGDWSIRTRSEAWLHADKDAFYPRAKLEAWEGEKKVFEREFRRKIPRNGV